MCLRQAPCISFFMGCHLFASFLAFSASFSIMPLELEARENVDSGLTGLILSMLYVPTFILGLFLNKLAHTCGRKTLYLSGLYTFTVATILFGLIEYIPEGKTFIAVSIIIRVIVGFGSFFTKTILPSIMSKRFPHHMDAMFTFMGIWITIALGVGPALGQQLYGPLGDNFFYPHLLVFFIIVIIFIPSAHFMLKERSLTRSNSSMFVRTESPDLPRQTTSPEGPTPTNSQMSNERINGRRKVKRLKTTVDETPFPVVKIFLSCRAVVLSLVIFWNIFYLLYWQSALALELESYDKSDNYISFAYLLRAIVAIPISLTVPAISKRLGRVISIFLSSLIHFFAFFFLGPSKIFNLPANPNLILLGLAMKGIADPFMFNLCIPEIIEVLLLKYKGKYTIGPISDVVSGFENFTLDIASMVGTTIGFVMYKAIGFRYTCDFYFLLQIPFLLALTIWGGVIPAFRDKFRSKRDKVQQDQPPNTERELKKDHKEMDQEEPTPRGPHLDQ